jgi:hypothetical protein
MANRRGGQRRIAAGRRAAVSARRPARDAVADSHATGEGASLRAATPLDAFDAYGPTFAVSPFVAWREDIEPQHSQVSRDLPRLGL